MKLFKNNKKKPNECKSTKKHRVMLVEAIGDDMRFSEYTKKPNECKSTKKHRVMLVEAIGDDMRFSEYTKKMILNY